MSLVEVKGSSTWQISNKIVNFWFYQFQDSIDCQWLKVTTNSIYNWLFVWYHHWYDSLWNVKFDFLDSMIYNICLFLEDKLLLSLMAIVSTIL